MIFRHLATNQHPTPTQHPIATLVTNPNLHRATLQPFNPDFVLKVAASPEAHAPSAGQDVGSWVYVCHMVTYPPNSKGYPRLPKSAVPSHSDKILNHLKLSCNPDNWVSTRCHMGRWILNTDKKGPLLSLQMSCAFAGNRHAGIRNILRCSRARASQFWLLSWSVAQAAGEANQEHRGIHRGISEQGIWMNSWMKYVYDWIARVQWQTSSNFHVSLWFEWRRLTASCRLQWHVWWFTSPLGCLGSCWMGKL